MTTEPGPMGTEAKASHPASHLKEGPRILLINPRTTYHHEIGQKCFPPQNLLGLAGALAQKGLSARVLDANAFGLSDEAIAVEAQRLGPRIIGLPLYSDILGEVRDLSVRLAQACPDAIQVAGGPHVTAAPEATLDQLETLDYLLLGEADETLPALCQMLLTQGRALGPLQAASVPGVMFRERSSLRQGPVAPFPPPEAWAEPARDLVSRAYHENRYYALLVRARPVDTLVTSRGCPFSCGFCYNFRHGYRARSPESVLHELTRIRDRGIRDVEFVDDTFTLDKGRALALLDAIRRERLGVSFRIKSRVDIFDQRLARAAQSAGVYQVSFGMESGSQRLLDAMHKRTTVAQIANATALCKAHGMLCHGSFVIGYPGETPDTAEQTLRLIQAIRPTTMNLLVLKPYPGTRVYLEARAAGTLVNDWHPDLPMPWVRLPWTRDRRDLETLAARLMRRIYLSPWAIATLGSLVLRGANLTLARYALQEAKKLWVQVVRKPEQPEY